MIHWSPDREARSNGCRCFEAASISSDFQVLPGEVQKQWRQWVNQVPVIGFNSGKYDLKIYEPRYIAYLATSGSKRETTK